MKLLSSAYVNLFTNILRSTAAHASRSGRGPATRRTPFLFCSGQPRHLCRHFWSTAAAASYTSRSRIVTFCIL